MCKRSTGNNNCFFYSNPLAEREYLPRLQRSLLINLFRQIISFYKYAISFDMKCLFLLSSLSPPRTSANVAV